MPTIPRDWRARYRPDDDELVGYLVPDGDLVVPVTLFGSPLAAACDEGTAVALLDAEGLACLADRWNLDRDGEQVSVAVMEVTPERLVLRNVDWGTPDEFGTQYVLPVPVTVRLARAGRLSGSHLALPPQ